jgi:RNA recognition motif-containing protein
MLKGFGFINFSTKKDALTAISAMDGKTILNRRIGVSLAQQKEEYKKTEETRKETEKEEKIVKEEEKKFEIREKSENQPPKKLVNDPKRTLFIRNLGFQTDEETLKDFFRKHGGVEYVKIVRNPETKTSKGTAFVCMKNESDALELHNMFERSENDRDSINPFELEGRNIKILPCISKEDAKTAEKENIKKKLEDPRRRDLLYYGLINIHDTSEEDQEKREYLIGLKKNNYGKNPNYHVSTTRLTIRNIEKLTTEDNIKDIVREKINSFIESLDDAEKKIYKKIKKVKQVKVLRDKKEIGKDDLPKSKGCAFVEVCDEKLGKYLIDNMSDYKISKKYPGKGLILDFALDDIRKVNKRKNKLKNLKEKRKAEKAEDAENQVTDKSKKPKEIKEEEKIEDVNDINKLLEIFHNTISRGKRQRIKKKLRKLGYTKKPEKIAIKPKEENKQTKDTVSYSAVKIENDKTDLNKKFKKEKKEKKTYKEKNLLKRKMKRDQSYEVNSDEDDNIEMSGYISQINQNLKNSGHKEY